MSPITHHFQMKTQSAVTIILMKAAQKHVLIKDNLTYPSIFNFFMSALH